MPKQPVTEVEGCDEESAIKALRLAELGPVSFSDKYTFIRYLEDPDEVASYIEQSIFSNIKFVVRRVASEPKALRPIIEARVEGRDEQAALKALELIDKGPVDYSDTEFGTIRGITDPDKLTEYLEHSFRHSLTFVVERAR